MIRNSKEFGYKALHNKESVRIVRIVYCFICREPVLFTAIYANFCRPVLTNFYLITYALTNLACFLLVVAKVPNFRPVWRWYSWHASLFATIVVTAAMFYLDVLFAFVTVLIVLVFFRAITPASYLEYA